MTSSNDPSWTSGSAYSAADPYPAQPPSAQQPHPSGYQAYNAGGAGDYQQAPYAQPGYQQPYAPMYAGAPQKSKVAAGCLGIFLGALGVHNFYLGYTGKAVAQLLLTVLSFGFLSWVSGIWGFIEGILILTATPGSVPWGVDAEGVPLQN